MTSAASQAQVESLFDKLNFSTGKKMVVEADISKNELVAEESGENIDEVFIKLYGEPCKPICSEEQREIIQRKMLGGETPKSEEAFDFEVSNGRAKTKEALVEVQEDVVEPKTAPVEHAAEVDLDELFQEMENSKANEKLFTENETEHPKFCILL